MGTALFSSISVLDLRTQQKILTVTSDDFQKIREKNSGSPKIGRDTYGVDWDVFFFFRVAKNCTDAMQVCFLLPETSEVSELGVIENIHVNPLTSIFSFTLCLQALHSLRALHLLLLMPNAIRPSPPSLLLPPLPLNVCPSTALLDLTIIGTRLPENSNIIPAKYFHVKKNPGAMEQILGPQLIYLTTKLTSLLKFSPTFVIVTILLILVANLFAFLFW
jgi:hypothetical protein